jgi:hypothetical protein
MILDLHLRMGDLMGMTLLGADGDAEGVFQRSVQEFV